MMLQEHTQADPPQQPPALCLLDIKEVAKRTSLSRTTIWRRLKNGDFPDPLRLSEQCVRWREDDINAWVIGLPARQK